ncbi:sugar phosphate isomerase/epimerase family protein [Pelagibacterium limicola]|uniref:sugar phosphate isomerase/epimerase family protein n=1 Tax=Pelagibacterium limicola TaxID=2791022 RepID=UPI0018AFD576|nr:sugar phosphate isomerase/epimerase [Pelagibacterium limicola]
MLIGNAPCSWGIFYSFGNRIDAQTYLDEVAGAGYRATELGPFGFLPTDSAALGAALEMRGLALSGAVHVHAFSDPVSGPQLDAKLMEVGRLLQALGSKHLVIMDEGNAYPAEAIGILDADRWRTMCAMIEEARKRVEGELGLTLSFHPHVATAVEREEQIDRLLEETGIALCFDTGHHAFWDQDPLAYMEKVWDRIAYMHLKNVDGAVRARVLAGELGVRESFAQGVMCPLPDGVVDIGAALEMLVTRNFSGPIIVEQDPSDDPALHPASLAVRNAAFVAGIVGTLKP